MLPLNISSSFSTRVNVRFPVTSSVQSATPSIVTFKQAPALDRVTLTFGAGINSVDVALIKAFQNRPFDTDSSIEYMNQATGKKGRITGVRLRQLVDTHKDDPSLDGKKTAAIKDITEIKLPLGATEAALVKTFRHQSFNTGSDFQYTDLTSGDQKVIPGTKLHKLVDQFKNDSRIKDETPTITVTEIKPLSDASKQAAVAALKTQKGPIITIMDEDGLQRGISRAKVYSWTPPEQRKNHTIYRRGKELEIDKALIKGCRGLSCDTKDRFQFIHPTTQEEITILGDTLRRLLNDYKAHPEKFSITDETPTIPVTKTFHFTRPSKKLQSSGSENIFQNQNTADQ